MPVSQSWMTAVRVIGLLFLFLPAIVADVVVAEVVLGRHLFQALDAVVLAGALVELAAGGGAGYFPPVVDEKRRDRTSVGPGGLEGARPNALPRYAPGAAPRPTRRGPGR